MAVRESDVPAFEALADLHEVEATWVQISPTLGNFTLFMVKTQLHLYQLNSYMMEFHNCV